MRLTLTICLVLIVSSNFAYAETLLKFSSTKNAKIALMPLDVELSLLTASGINEPKSEWTEAAKGFIKASAEDYFSTNEVGIVDGSNIEGEELVDVLSLHEVVGPTIMLHHYGIKLPSKRGELDWSLGDEAAVLGEALAADYGLFVYVRDSYASGGRMALQVVAAIGGVGIQGGMQIGFASLVDLRTGNIVWFNRLVSATGDLRKADPAEKTMKKLLKDFPL